MLRPLGGGKTRSARHDARWDLLEPVLTPQLLDPETPTPPAVAACRCVVSTPAVSTTPKQLGRELDRLCRGLSWTIEELRRPDEPHRYAGRYRERTELVLVDEADRLKLPALEELRDRDDRGHLGLVLIGLPGRETRLARYAQFFSRVGFVHVFRPLTGAELDFVLACHWQTLGLALDPEDPGDAKARAAIARITGGNFRLIHRLFLRAVTEEVVIAARESLVVGPL